MKAVLTPLSVHVRVVADGKDHASEGAEQEVAEYQLLPAVDVGG